MRKILTMLIIVAGAIFTLSCLNPLMPEGGGTGGTSIIDGHDIDLVSVQASIPSSYDDDTDPIPVTFRVKNMGTNTVYPSEWWSVYVYYKTAEQLPIESYGDLNDGGPRAPVFIDFFVSMRYADSVSIPSLEAGEFRDVTFDFDINERGMSNETYYFFFAFNTPLSEASYENNYAYIGTSLCETVMEPE